MSKGKMILIGVLVGILLLAISLYGFFRGTYNQFISLDEGVKSSWAQVENQLQRRFDLIRTLSRRSRVTPSRKRMSWWK
ncbi:MAG: hypothetical protein M0Q01_08965 [Syntrophales bacterium]|jgi:LemA protein|nr:hypothetical protein [Syntrophales bacterium]